MKKKKKVVVALSGGVDSSAVLILLKKQDFDLVGVSFKYSAWQSPKNKLKENVCCSDESFKIAEKICQKLKVPYQIVDQQKEFKKQVIEYYLSVLKNKRTPNPCVVCNRLVKFKKLLAVAEEFKADFIATGHYARIKQKQGEYQLLRAKDKKKDQTYFLCLLTQQELAKTLFPLGDYQKKQVYQIVEKAGFDYFKKMKQSQDLCFVSSQSVSAFLESELGKQPGKIIDLQGNYLGDHSGLFFYTIGQRKGLNLPNGPWYVVRFNQDKNELIVTNQEDDPALFAQKVKVKNFNFINSQKPDKKDKLIAKTRLNQELTEGFFEKIKPSETIFNFIQPQKAITPGQWLVVYSGQTCLGGGIIDSVE